MHSAIVISNFFRVTDEKEFARFIKKWDLTARIRDPDRVGFQRTGKDSFGIPRAHTGQDGRPVAGDLLKDLSRIILDEEVAVVVENIVSTARAVIRLNAMAVKKGEDPIRLSLNQIYDLAFEKWGVIPSKIDWAP